MVLQDTLTEVSQRQGLSEDHMELLDKVMDDNFDSIFQKYDQDGNSTIPQRSFFAFFQDLMEEYNEALDQGEGKRKVDNDSDDSLDKMMLDDDGDKGKLKPPKPDSDQFDGVHRTQSGSLTKETLTKSLEEKDKMLQEFKQNTDNYSKFAIC